MHISKQNLIESRWSEGKNIHILLMGRIDLNNFLGKSIPVTDLGKTLNKKLNKSKTMLYHNHNMGHINLTQVSTMYT